MIQRRWAVAVFAAIAAIIAAFIIWYPTGAGSQRGEDLNPSGEWVPIFNDSFSGPIVVAPKGPQWTAYSGIPGGNPDGLWDPENLSIGGGQMLLRTTRRGNTWITAGVSNKIAQTYGQWQVRMRMPYSTDVKFVVQLWPSEGWPPEIDFAERRSPTGYNAFTHWGTPADQVPGRKLQTVDRLTGIDMNDWHVVGVMWRPDLIEYTIDGRVWATVQGVAVPNQPMWLAIQTEGTRPASDGSAQPPDMQVSNVSIWSWKAAPTPSGSNSSTMSTSPSR